MASTQCGKKEVEVYLKRNPIRLLGSLLSPKFPALYREEYWLPVWRPSYPGFGILKVRCVQVFSFICCHGSQQEFADYVIPATQASQNSQRWRQMWGILILHIPLGKRERNISQDEKYHFRISYLSSWKMSFSKYDSWRMIVIPGAMNFIKSRILIDLEGDDCKVTKRPVKVAIKPKLSRRKVRKVVNWLQILLRKATVFKTGPLGDLALVKIHCKLISKCSCSLIACKSVTFKRT